MAPAPFPRAAIPAGRCPRCAFPPAACLCPAIPHIRTPFRFVILRHASEIPRMTNSGRWAALALEGSLLRDHAGDATPSAEALAGLLQEPSVLLYPAPGAPPAALRPRTIVVPDATWSQARRMVQRLGPLQTLPRLSLPVAAAGAASRTSRLRRSTVAGGLTTLEAIAAALELLGEPAAAAELRALHDAALERTLRLKGMWPPGRNPHRGRPG